MSGDLFMMRLWKYVDVKKLDNKKDSSVTLKVTKESSTPPIKNNTNVTASEVVKKESKPYDIEYDETSSDM